MPYEMIVIIVVIVFYAVSFYNRLVALNNRVKSAWAQIDVQLKRRYDLIPNLVAVAKGYMEHEQQTLEKVVKARQLAMSVYGSGNVPELAKAENMLSQTMRSFLALAENYPALQANQQMLQLQEELTTTENRIAFARQHYNDEVMRFNTRIERFPENILAERLHFTQEPYFEIKDPNQLEVTMVKI